MANKELLEKPIKAEMILNENESKSRLGLPAAQFGGEDDGSRGKNLGIKKRD